MASMAAFATVSATRPYFLPAMIVAGISIVIVSPSRVRTLALISVIPGAVLAGWVARQSVLSGYPLFPLKIAALPVDWRIPRVTIDEENAWVRSWARTPGKSPDAVLGSWSWLPGWLRRGTSDLDLLLPFVLTLFALARLRGSQVRRTIVAGALAPLLLTLVIWFLSAPSPRFVYGPLWLVRSCYLRAGRLIVRSRSSARASRYSRAPRKFMGAHQQTRRRPSRVLQPPDTNAPDLHNTQRPDHPNTRW